MAVGCPIIVPAAIALGSIIGLVYLPYGAGKLVQKTIHKQYELSQYHRDKIGFVKERAETLIEKLTLDDIRSAYEGTRKQIKNYLDKFFKSEMPFRILQAERRLKNIEIHIKKPFEVRRQHYYVQQEILNLYGKMVVISYEMFRYNHIDTKGTATQQKNVFLQNIIFKDEVVQARRKSIRYQRGSEKFFTDVGEATVLRLSIYFEIQLLLSSI